jgi:hypothetical protein
VNPTVNVVHFTGYLKVARAWFQGERAGALYLIMEAD